MSCFRQKSLLRRALELRGSGAPVAGAPGPNWNTCAGLAHRLRDQAGWTLAELMVVTGLIVTLAGIAVPQFSLMAVQMRTQAAAAQVMSDLNWTRMMSLRTGVPHYINVTGDPPMIYNVHRTANPAAVAPGTDPVIRAIDLTASMRDVDFSLNGVTLDPYGGTVTAPSPGQIVFTARGLPTAPGAFFVASDDGKTAFAISITGAGRTRMWRRRDGAWK